MPVDPSQRDKIIAQLMKKMGDGSIHKGNESEDVYRIPFRSPALNRATEGGVPIGRFSLFWGSPSGFKTSLIFELMAQAQILPQAAEKALMPLIKLYREEGNISRVKRLTEELEFIQGTFPDGMEINFYNAEQTYDPKYAADKGVDVDRIDIVEKQIIEDIVGVMEATYLTHHMHVVDSTSNASSIEEKNMKMTDRRMGLDARVWKQTVRKSMDKFDTSENVGLLINQVSTNLRTGGEQAVTTKFLSHTSAMTIRTQRGRFLYRKDGLLVEDKPPGADEQSYAGRAEADGVEIWAEVEKSKVCRPFRKAFLQADFMAKDFDNAWELAQGGIKHGLIIKSGSWYRVNGEDEQIGQGLKVVKERVEQDQDLADRIYAAMMKEIDEEAQFAPQRRDNPPQE